MYSKNILIAGLFLFIIHMAIIHLAVFHAFAGENCIGCTGCSADKPACSSSSISTDMSTYENHPNASYLKITEPMVDNAMQGYNKEDHQAFYKDYTKSMASVATESTFKMMVMNMWKKETGNYKSRKLIDSRCSFNDSAPLLVYEADFENAKKILSVNFLKEEDELKIVQIVVTAK
jgi:hypothetical protein